MTAHIPPGQPVRRLCPDREVIFQEGDLSDFAWTIIAGQVALSKRGPYGPVPLAMLGEGEMFGEMGVLDGTVRSATAMASGPVTLEGLDRDGLLAVLKEQPDSALTLIKTMSRRLRVSTELAVKLPQPERRSAWRRLRSWLHGVVHRDREAFERLRRQFQPDAVELDEQPLPGAAMAILYTIVAAIVCGVTWASLAKVDRIVAAQGRIVTDQPLITVQPMETAVIRALPVQAGQIVQAGQVVAELDPTFATADEGANRADMGSASAMAARLEAELADKNPPHFSDDAREDLVQRALFDSRIAERASQRKAFDEELGELDAHLRTAERERALLREQRATVAELEVMRRKLMNDGYGSRVNWLDARHSLQSADREIERQTNTMNELNHRTASARAKRDAFESEWRSKAAQELTDARRVAARSREQVRKSERMTDLVELRAPTRAMVLEIGQRAVGSVVRQGDTVLSLVAVDVPLQAEVSIQPKDIAYVRIGDEARVKVDAFPYQKHGTLTGRVRTLNGDVLSEEKEGRRSDVYKARIDLGTLALREVPPDYALVSGMSMTAEIKVGTRRLISYVLYPVMRTLDSALREP